MSIVFLICLIIVIVIIVIIGFFLFFGWKKQNKKKRYDRKARTPGSNKLARINGYDNLRNVYIIGDNQWHAAIIRHFIPYSNIIKYEHKHRKILDEDDILVFDVFSDQKVIDRFPAGFKIMIDSEPKNLTGISRGLDMIITTKKTLLPTCPNMYILYIPFYSLSFCEKDKLYKGPLELLHIKRDWNEWSKRPKLVAFMYSNCDSQYEGVRYREEFFDIMKERLGDQVVSLGKCKNDNYISNGTWWNAVDIFREFKYVIAIENSFIPGYITEKLVNPLIAGCIPIYYGSEDVGEHFNSKSFIILNPIGEASIIKAVNSVIEMMNDDRRIKYIYDQNPILENGLNKHFDWFYRDIIFDEMAEVDTTSIGESKIHKRMHIINLGRSKDRMNAMINQMSRLNIVNYERCEAIYGRDVYDEYKNLMSFRERKTEPGELGVYLSNLKLWRQLLEDRNNDYYVILEDDTILTESFENKLENHLKDMPAWDIIFLGLNKNYCNVEKKYKDKKDKYIRLDNKCMPGAFAYVVNKRGAAYLSRFAFPMYSPVDEYIKFNMNTLNIYAIINPTLVSVEYDNSSTIHPAEMIEII